MKKILVALSLMLVFLSSCVTSEVETSSEIEYEVLNQFLIRIKANRNRGYNYDAYLKLPNYFRHDITDFLLVIPNNTGQSGTIETHDKSARNAIFSGSWESWIAKQLGTPLLMPVFPRTGDIYYHDLTYDALTATGKARRVDHQLMAMIVDAITLLEDLYNKEFHDKVLMVGASASGDFVSRFTILHPEYVHAVVTALNAGLPMLPVSRFKSYRQTYPFGTADIKRFEKDGFNKEAFKNVKILSMNGNLDNDSTGYIQGSNIKPYTREEIFSIFGSTIKERCEISSEIFLDITNNYQAILYRDIGHNIVREDAVAFLKANLGDEFVPVVPSEPVIMNTHYESALKSL